MSLVGYGVGASVDADPEKYYQIAGYSEFIVLKPGTKIMLRLKSGEEIKGKYISVVSVPSKGYADLYARAKDLVKDEIALPALGEKITIVKQTGTWLKPEFSRKEDAEFLGFDYWGIRVWETGQPQPMPLPIGSIQSLSDQQGHALNVNLIKRLVSEHKIPFLSSATILLKSIYGETRTDLADVYLIKVEGRHYRTNYFLAGLIIDILLEVIHPWCHFWFLFLLRSD